MSAITFVNSAILILVLSDKDLKMSIHGREAEIDFSWKKEILPFQWRIALSSTTGYFSLYLFTPVTFNVFGAVEAGGWACTCN